LGHNLQSWLGYDVSTKWFYSGIYLNIDTATKFLNSKTVYENIKEKLKQRFERSEIIAEYLK
jgi:hypothetical protein